MTKPLIRFKKFHYYLIPLISLIVWWGMLIALLAAWAAQGKPIYSFMSRYQNPVYISDVAATNLQPLFIACSSFQAIFFVGTLVMGIYLRKKEKIQPYILTTQPKFAIASVVCAVIGQLGIIFTSIFNTNHFHTLHLTMVGIFIAFCFFACCCDFVVLFKFGNNPDKLNPMHDGVKFGTWKWANLYMVSFFLKCVWLAAAFSFVICFGYFMGHMSRGLSASFEWLIAFWYGLLLILWSMDLFPSALRHYRRKHPNVYQEKNNEPPLTSLGSEEATFVNSQDV